MSVYAKLLIDDKEVEVLSYSFSFKQDTDARNRPIANPLFTGLQVVITARKDLNLAQWALSPIETRQLELHMYPILMGGKTKKVYFYDCQLVDWNTSFDATGSQTLRETLHITAEGVKNADVTTEYSTFFRKTFRNSTPPITREEPEKEVANYFLTTIEGRKITDYEVGDTIIVNLKTKNRIGDVITIDLNDPEYDFEYNGTPLKDDILQNYIIGNDTEQIPFKVIQQKKKN